MPVECAREPDGGPQVEQPPLPAAAENGDPLVPGDVEENPERPRRTPPFAVFVEVPQERERGVEIAVSGRLPVIEAAAAGCVQVELLVAEAEEG